MHFFFHDIVQAIYLVSWAFILTLILEYQFKAYAWMIKTRQPISFIPNQFIFVWAITLVVFAVILAQFTAWIDWPLTARFVRYSAPILILIEVMRNINYDRFYVYEMYVDVDFTTEVV
jgi:hypothetical protein